VRDDDKEIISTLCRYFCVVMINACCLLIFFFDVNSPVYSISWNCLIWLLFFGKLLDISYMVLSQNNEDNRETISAMIRRYIDYNNRPKPAKRILTFGNVVLDIANRIVTVDDADAGFTRLEFDILYFIVSRDGELLSYKEISEYAWNGGYASDSMKPLAKMVNRIKNRINPGRSGPDHIINVREYGYRYRKAE